MSGCCFGLPWCFGVYERRRQEERKMSEEVVVRSVVDPGLARARARDMFLHGYSGYWAFGVSLPEDVPGWIVYEKVDGPAPSKEESERVLRAFLSGERKLPDRWHVLDEDVAKRAWAEGVRRWGERWYEDGDGPRYDAALQLALLGEVRYG